MNMNNQRNSIGWDPTADKKKNKNRHNETNEEWKMTLLRKFFKFSFGCILHTTYTAHYTAPSKLKTVTTINAAYQETRHTYHIHCSMHL